MTIVAIIPARGGSKGIPGKNLRPLGGVSLLARAVATATAAGCVDRVVVSTDDRAIADEARRAGAGVIVRPTEIAGDRASSEAALLHALETLERDEGYRPEITVFMQCTAPFTRAEDVDGTVEALRAASADAAFAAVPFHHFVWRPDAAAGWSGVNHDSVERQMRQQRPEEVLEAGAVYAMRTDRFLEKGHRFCGRLAVWRMPAERFLEIDEPGDLARAERLIGAAAGPRLPFAPRAVVFDFDGVMTDDRVWVDENGAESVACNRRDGMGVGLLRARGVPVLILSKETNPVVRARAEKLQVDFVQGCDEKLPALREWCTARGVPLKAVAYVGNDINDVACMNAAGLGVSVADAHPEAHSAAAVILTMPGGHGAVREFADLVVRKLEEAYGEEVAAR